MWSVKVGGGSNKMVKLSGLNEVHSSLHLSIIHWSSGAGNIDTYTSRETIDTFVSFPLIFDHSNTLFNLLRIQGKKRTIDIQAWSYLALCVMYLSNCPFGEELTDENGSNVTYWMRRKNREKNVKNRCLNKFEEKAERGFWCFFLSSLSFVRDLLLKCTIVPIHLVESMMISSSGKSRQQFLFSNFRSIPLHYLNSWRSWNIYTLHLEFDSF